MLVPHGPPAMRWRADPSITTEEVAAAPKGVALTEDLVLLDADGVGRPAKGDIDRVLAPPLDFEGEYVVSHDFEAPTWLQIAGSQPLKVVGFDSRQTWVTRSRSGRRRGDSRAHGGAGASVDVKVAAGQLRAGEVRRPGTGAGERGAGEVGVDDEASSSFESAKSALVRLAPSKRAPKRSVPGPVPARNPG